MMLDFTEADAPQKGGIVKVSTPLTLRSSVESTDAIGVALARQRLRIDEISNKDISWAALTVVE